MEKPFDAVQIVREFRDKKYEEKKGAIQLFFLSFSTTSAGILPACP
jgi:hypothetical protein